MRATWPGARSGRISMVTGPCVVSRIKVFSVSAMLFLRMGWRFQGAELDGSTSDDAGLGVCSLDFCKWPRRAALQRPHDGKPARITALAPHLMSDATCTFTILSGSVTAPPAEPGGAFFSLSTTSMPCTTSPITVYWLLRDEASSKQMKNCEFAVSTLSPRRAMPTVPRLKGALENSCFRFGYFEPPVPLKFCPSPVCAMKPSITRWNGTLL